MRTGKVLTSIPESFFFNDDDHTANRSLGIQDNSPEFGENNDIRGKNGRSLSGDRAIKTKARWKNVKDVYLKKSEGSESRSRGNSNSKIATLVVDLMRQRKHSSSMGRKQSSRAKRNTKQRLKDSNLIEDLNFIFTPPSSDDATAMAVRSPYILSQQLAMSPYVARSERNRDYFSAKFFFLHLFYKMVPFPGSRPLKLALQGAGIMHYGMYHGDPVKVRIDTNSVDIQQKGGVFRFDKQVEDDKKNDTKNPMHNRKNTAGLEVSRYTAGRNDEGTVEKVDDRVIHVKFLVDK
jgi:hypothetical protein